MHSEQEHGLLVDVIIGAVSSEPVRPFVTYVRDLRRDAVGNLTLNGKVPRIQGWQYLLGRTNVRAGHQETESSLVQAGERNLTVSWDRGEGGRNRSLCQREHRNVICRRRRINDGIAGVHTLLHEHRQVLRYGMSEV